jgi:type I restriction enzyme S subunit
VPLGEIVEVLDRFRVPVNREERAKRQGAIPYYGATGQVGWIDDYIFDQEIVLLGEDGAPFLEPHKPKAYIVRGKSWVNNHAHVLIGKAGVYNAFLLHQLNCIDYRDFVSGTTRLKLPQGSMLNIFIRLAPEKEQVRIVDELEKQLSRLDSSVESLRRVHAGLSTYRASILKAACEGRLVPTEAELAREEGRECAAIDRSLMIASEDLPSLPEGWIWTDLERLTTDGPQNGLYLPQAAYGSGTPIIRIDDYQFSTSRSSSELRRVTATPDIEQAYLVREGDLLINRVNSPSHLGKTLLIEKRHLPALFESNMMRLHLSKQVDPAFVQLYLQSPAGRRRLTQNAKWAVNQASINQKDVLNTPVPLPLLDEQIRIVSEVQRCLSLADSLRYSVEDALKRATTLRSAILKSAFTGKLVSKDPTDEPASTLLERIRAARGPEASAVRTRRSRSEPALLSGDMTLQSRIESVATEPDPGKPPFAEHDPSEQMALAWEILFGRGLFEKEDAVRAVAERLRDQGLAHFQRLRKDSPLFNDIASAIDRGVRQSFFDRPKRGHVRAILPDPKAYSPDDWRLCLLGVLDGEPVEEEDALRAAAEWARETMGLEFARLRENGVILQGLRAALKEAVGRGEVTRKGGRVFRSSIPRGDHFAR